MGLFRKSPVEKAQKALGKTQQAMEAEDWAAVESTAREALSHAESGGEEAFYLVPTCHLMVGLGLFNQGRHDEAHAEYEKLLACHEEGPLKDLDEMTQAAANLGMEFAQVGKTEMVLPWFDSIADAYLKEGGTARLLAGDAHLAKYRLLAEAGDQGALSTLDAAYEAFLEDPYGYVLSNRAGELNVAYRECGEAERALGYVDRGIALLHDRYTSGDVSDETSESFIGDVARFRTYQQELKERGTTPRPIVTLQAERARLLLDLEGREDDVLASCEIVADAREADSKRMQEAQSEDGDEDGPDMAELQRALMEQLGSMGAQVSVAPMAAGATSDVYESEFLYTFGEAARRKGDLEAAKSRLEMARQSVDEDEDPELAQAIDEALAKC